MGWQYMKHPDIALGQRFPDDPDVIAAQEARGWVRHSMPAALDPDSPNTGAIVQATDAYESQPILSEAAIEELKGAELTEQLEAAGLPKSGTVAEKRARLAEHEAGLAGSTTTEGND